MSDSIMRLETDLSTRSDIESHLQECDAQFVPPLGTRIDIANYASKLHSHATRFEAWCDAKLVGLVAVYFNTARRECFITSVSVLAAFHRQHIAFDLIMASRQSAIDRGMLTMVLEVAKTNFTAISLYQKLGFQIDSQCNEIVHMRMTTHK